MSSFKGRIEKKGKFPNNELKITVLIITIIYKVSLLNWFPIVIVVNVLIGGFSGEHLK